jgi:hypothetical protein
MADRAKANTTVTPITTYKPTAARQPAALVADERAPGGA